MRLVLAAIAAVAAAGFASPASAQQTGDPVVLAPMVNSADRIQESEAITATDTSLITPGQLAQDQLTTLADALAQLPGGPVFAAGREGASASLFLRGSDSDQVLFMVDGIRFNDANTDYGPFLGGWRVSSTDAIEVDRGPQGALYGAGASGGVVALSTPAGSGAPTASLEVEGGSLDTVQGVIHAQGTWDGVAYNLSDAAGTTDNGRPNNDFKSNNLTLRLDKTLWQNLAVGGTVRVLDDRYGDPGDIYANNPYDHETEEDLIGTLFAKATMGDYFTSRLTLGGVFRDFDAFSADGGAPPSESETRDERGVADAQVNGRLTANNLLTSGVDLEASATHDNSFGAIDAHEDLTAYYLQDDYTPTQEIHLTAGLRRDDTTTWGASDTGRVTLAVLGATHLVKLRGSYGTGFNEPSLLDLYGAGPGYAGNPNLLPEHSRGWDAGFDFYMPDDVNQVLSVTWFDTQYTNLIEDDFELNPATPINIDRARSRGLEVAWTTKFASAIQARIAYTYLLAEDVTDQVPLLRRPRDSFSADLFFDATNGFTVGASGAYIGRRADIDALTYDPVADPGYTVVRVYARYRFNAHWAIHARIENALDRVYYPVNGYSGAPRQIIGGVEYKF
jgi:vitamin B12 transporter